MKNLEIRIIACAAALLIGSIASAQGGPIIPSVKKLGPNVKGLNSLRKVKTAKPKALRTDLKGKKKKSAFRKIETGKKKPNQALTKPKTKASSKSLTNGSANIKPSNGETTKGDAPAWQQVKASERGDPTLSADFIRNCAKITPKERRRMKFSLDIYDEELEAVVKLIACMTGENIILSKSLKGKKITIYSPSKVTADEAYRAFLTALENNGFTLSRQGKFLRVIDIKDYVRSSDPLIPAGKQPPARDQMVTQFITVKNIDAEEAKALLEQLKSTNASIIPYRPSNSLIITELGSNLRKLRSILEAIDVPGKQDELWVYQVLHAEAGDIASKIMEIFERNDGKSGRSGKKKSVKKRGKSKLSAKSVGESDLDVQVTKVIADERTNRLFIMSTRRNYRQVKRLIERLDIAVEGDGQVHIHQLNHAKAADLANVLSNLSQNQRKGSSRKSSRRSKAKKSKKSKKSSRPGATSAALFEGEVSVTADEDTNALVITASLKDYLALKRVIEALDRPRRQVFIEAVVMEVSVDSERKVGISLHAGATTEDGDSGTTLLFGNQNGATSPQTVLDLGSASTLTGLAVQGPQLELFGQKVPSFGAIMRALAENNDVNVLSTPHILTTDNEEAEIVVGDNVPFVTGFSGGFGGSSGGLGGLAGGLSLPTVNVQRQDVALTLKITPRINAASFVTLEVDQVVEEISAINDRTGPTTSKRSVKSTVVVKDQHTVVIGGLQKQKQNHSKSAFPFLGEIPVIGYLFRNSTKRNSRVNLLLLLTPHVIEGPQDFQAIMKRKLEEHEEFVERFNRKGDQLVLGLDYRKKHGALEAIHKALAEIQKEEDLMAELRRQEKRPPLPQELDGARLNADDEDDEEDEESEMDGKDNPADDAPPPPEPAPTGDDS